MEKSPTSESGVVSEQSSAPVSLKDHALENTDGHDAVVSEKPTANTASTDVPVPPTEIAEETKKPQPQADDYIEGLQLWVVMTGLCLVFFLVLLDTSILATVSTDRDDLHVAD